MPQSLAISVRRTNCESDASPSKINVALNPVIVHGIMGIISLTTCRWHSCCSIQNPDPLKAEYLVVISKRELKGQLFGHNIYRAAGFELLPLQSSSNPPQVTERYLLSLIKSHLNGSLLWFSYDWDMTRRLQAQYVARPGDAGKALWESVMSVASLLVSYWFISGRWQIFLE